MGALVGLGLGFGLLLIWFATTDEADATTGSGRRLDDRATRLLRSAGVTSVSSTALLLLCALSGFMAGLAVFVISATATVALAFACIGAYAPVAALRGRARRRRRELADVWPEAVDNLASAVRAGLSLAEGLAQLGERGPAPLRAAFRRFGDDYLATGRFGDSLDALKVTLADPVGDRVIEALRVAREVGGGDLGRLLRSLSSFLRDDARTRGELEARQAWVVNGARLAVASPWLVLLMLSFQHEVIVRYASTGGVLVLMIGAGLCVTAYRLMVGIGRLPEPERVLE
jgi:tight adherence protein B